MENGTKTFRDIFQCYGSNIWCGKEVPMTNILAVEDDEKRNHIICAYLTRNGYQAKGCLNLVEA